MTASRPTLRESADRAARELLACAEAWEPDACLLGNVRASEIASVCRAALYPAASDQYHRDRDRLDSGCIRLEIQTADGRQGILYRDVDLRACIDAAMARVRTRPDDGTEDFDARCRMTDSCDCPACEASDD